MHRLEPMVRFTGLSSKVTAPSRSSRLSEREAHRSDDGLGSGLGV